ncbi:MAG: restriction endonuclease, partial [Deltaproteobacteria bacterium]|nr:restriction endonuclease [Deltaproteobacteria bacterium]
MTWKFVEIDKGIDVNGVLNAEGLADVVLRIQVKRVRGAIGNKEVLAIRGAAAQNEHPCLITLSHFTAQAREEAEAHGKA